MAADDTSNRSIRPNGRHHGGFLRRHSHSTRSGSTHVSGSMGELAERASGYLSRGAAQVREMARGREGSAVVVALIAGFGIGVLVGGTLASPLRHRREIDRWAADSIGRRVLDSIQAMIHATIAEHFGH
jgi:hypothetical protein